jgi:penicillin-binding protein 1C
MFRIFEILDGEADFQMPIADMNMMQICKQSGYKAGHNCPDTEMMPIAKSSANTPVCQNHVLIHLDETDTYKVSSICYPVQKMHIKPWFVLPPAQAWYYKKFNTNYTEPPGYLAGCVPEMSESMEMIYPRKFTRIFVPVEINGEPGKVIFEAAHQNPEAKVYWYLDQEYIGETRQNHQMGIFPAAGFHQISLVDSQGSELSVTFEATNEREL